MALFQFEWVGGKFRIMLNSATNSVEFELGLSLATTSSHKYERKKVGRKGHH
jgi:hypothetical protein